MSTRIFFHSGSGAHEIIYVELCSISLTLSLTVYLTAFRTAVAWRESRGLVTGWLLVWIPKHTQWPLIIKCIILLKFTNISQQLHKWKNIIGIMNIIQISFSRPENCLSPDSRSKKHLKSSVINMLYLILLFCFFLNTFFKLMYRVGCWGYFLMDNTEWIWSLVASSG